jgi:hypothetical protein
MGAVAFVAATVARCTCAMPSTPLYYWPSAGFNTGITAPLDEGRVRRSGREPA